MALGVDYVKSEFQLPSKKIKKTFLRCSLFLFANISFSLAEGILSKAALLGAKTVKGPSPESAF